ncbi:hypothetical protein DSM43518_03320 [Mycobacterium marinum]|uniref:hypothetical protein n=1 Tax=Mycobacterium marinum TaxID=1781 RepID=UPI000E3CF575|nr:hypothetical protein [Mycobacterium marinum]RFZ07578.1 hypothetical protein DSM43518_03320 [Mycobacterium marinum]
MAKKNDFTKRANDFLTARLGPAQRLGELLDAKAEKEAELYDCDAAIETAALQCIEAGWKPAELGQLGVPRTALPRRHARTPDNTSRSPQGGQAGVAANGGAAEPAP